MKFLNQQQIVDLVNQDTTRKIMFRHGDDLRFTNRDGMVERGSKRNREYSLFQRETTLLNLRNWKPMKNRLFFTVIPATICIDKVAVTLICMYMIGSTMIAIANKISK